MEINKAWVAKRWSRAKRIVRQGLVTCRELESEIACPQESPFLVYVNPTDLSGYVNLVLARRIRKTLRHAKIPVELSGNWSKKVTEWDMEDWYRVIELKQHFFEGVPWDELPSVKKKRQRLDQGYFVSDARTHELLDKRLESHDKLFEAIREDGGLSAAPEHLVQLNISETGALYWGPGGQHRIAMAVVLGLEAIPLKLGYVHTRGKWVLEQLLEQNERELHA